MTLAIVIPIYNEQENLAELKGRLERICATINMPWTVIYVNDGSRDRSEEMILEQQAQDGRFQLLSLSRNFGHQGAITAGLAHAGASPQVEAAVVMDGDLQDPPEVIAQLVECWRQGGEVVCAQRRSRQERGIRRLGFEVFHRLFGLVSDFPMQRDVGVYGLLDRQALDQLNQLSENNRYFPGLRAWIGFDQRTVFYDRQERSAGAPKQTLRRLVRYALDGVFSFSYKPLRLMMSLGLMISLVGFALACFFAARRILGVETAQTGFTTLVTLVLLLSGVQLVALGLLGEYLGRTYDEVKQRPLYIVRQRRRGGGVEAGGVGQAAGQGAGQGVVEGSGRAGVEQGQPGGEAAGGGSGGPQEALAAKPATGQTAGGDVAKAG